jgi:hypothetical protein
MPGHYQKSAAAQAGFLYPSIRRYCTQPQYYIARENKATIPFKQALDSLEFRKELITDSEFIVLREDCRGAGLGLDDHAGTNPGSFQ